MLSGKSIIIDYFVDNHYIDKIMGKLFTEKEVNLNQLILKAYLKARLLNLNYNFKAFKSLLIQQIVYYYIAFFQFKNTYFH